MTAFLAIEPGWLSHPKVIALSNDARVLWMAGALYAVALETDGRIERRMMPRLAQQAGLQRRRTDTVVSDLVDAGLWIDRGGVYEIHDFLKYNQSKAQREAQREKWRKAKARAGGYSHQESHEESEVDSTGIPRASLPCLALPTTKTLSVPPRNDGNGNSQTLANPPTDAGRSEIAEIRHTLAERGYRPPE